MLQVLFSWLVIGVASYIFGRAALAALYRGKADALRTPDICMAAGIVVVTVYAEFFSLFYKVAGIACVLLGAAGILIAALYVFRCLRRHEHIRRPGIAGVGRCRVAVAAVFVLATALWTLRGPGHYDTGLYHAQAIRWIEEYGVVPGLGNLHMRFAYNSAFMCLQALFSLQWLVGRSLHTVNGFCCALMAVYAVTTVRVRSREGAWRTSDWLKCATLLYIATVRWDISSPCTDIWAMLLVLYVCTKWCEFTEAGITDIEPWCCICLLSFYALTVKLSVAPFVMLTLWPLYCLIRERRGREIWKNVVGGLLIVLPYLIRNVIISGYLVYPYAQLDLFPVDWKMDPDVAVEDSLWIRAFGRGYNNLEDYYAAPVFRWIPHWFCGQSVGNRILVLVGAVCACVLLVRLWRYIRAKRFRETVFVTTILLCLFFWLAAAPLLRYGIAWLFIVIAAAAGNAGGQIKRHRLYAAVSAGMLLAVLLQCAAYGWDLPGGGFDNLEPVHLIVQAMYPAWPQTAYPIRGQEELSVWMPDEGDLGGYYAFPSTPQGGQFRHLGLRGDGFEDGFRYLPDAAG